MTGSAKRYVVVLTMIFLYKRYCSKTCNIFYLQGNHMGLSAIWKKIAGYSGTSLIRTAWDQHPFGLVKFRISPIMNIIIITMNIIKFADTSNGQWPLL